MAQSISVDNFIDNFEIARDFNCYYLKEQLSLFGKKNYQTLYSKGEL